MSYLFLDDIRIPEDAYKYTNNHDFISKKWDIVRSYDEFVEYITNKGLPRHIAFDHDIAEIHYTPQEYWDDYEASRAYQDAQNHEKTGYHCAMWLVEYCTDNNLMCPSFSCHSMNPVGKDRILGLLNNFVREQIKARKG